MKLVALLHALNEGKGLSKKDAMLVLREIETGRGGIAELAEKNPYLRDLSQDWIRDNIGEKVPLFRAVGVPEGETFREEGIVSGTTDWGVALRLAQDFPTIFSKDKTIHVNPHLVRYDIPVDRVLAYVPALVDMAVKTLGKEFVDKKRIVGRRYYSLISLHDVVEAGQTEKEVVADVSDIDPQVLKFSNNVTGRKMLAMVRDVGTGKYENPEQYLDFTQKHSSSFYTPSGRAEMLQRVGDQAGPMQRFLGESKSFLTEVEIGHTLYHGTTKDRAKDIMQYGLEPKVGELVKQAYGEYEYVGVFDQYKRELEPLGFAADKEGFGSVMSAMKHHIEGAVHNHRRMASDEDLLEYGAILVFRDAEEDFVHRSDDPMEYEEHPMQVEPGDWYTGYPTKPDYILTGKPMLRLLKRMGQWPLVGAYSATDTTERALKADLIRRLIAKDPNLDKRKVLDQVNKLPPKKLRVVLWKMQRVSESQIINELQLPKSPQFDNWFKGSEVVDDSFQPMPVFHGTETGDQFDTPHAWSHFGTSDAANAILGLGRDFQQSAIGPTGVMRNMRIMPFYLNIKNPLELHDYGEHNPDIWIRGIIKEIYGYGEYPGDGEPIENINTVMQKYGIPPEAVYAYANITRDYNSMYNYNDKIGLEHRYYEWLTQVVEQAGYDGIVYTNDIEDRGSISWVPIHQNQIMSAITAQAMTEERYKYIDPDGINKFIVGDGPESVRYSGTGAEIYRTSIYAIAPGHTGEIIKKEDGLYFVADQHNAEALIDDFPHGIDSFELVEGDVLNLEQKLDQKKAQQGKMSVFDYDDKWGERYVDPDPDMDKLNDVMRVEGARMKPEEFQTKWNEPYWGGGDDFGSTSKSRSSMWLDDDPYAGSRIDPSNPSVEDWVNWASYGIDNDEGMDPEQLKTAREMFHDNPVALKMLNKLKPKLKAVETYDDIFGRIIK
jgi:hypothetical protein